MANLINRQDAIEAICDEIMSRFDVGVTEGYELVEDALSGLPSVEPERKKGKWIDYSSEGFVECPFCHSATNCDDNKDELHYCFSCGADMRGEQDD